MQKEELREFVANELAEFRNGMQVFDPDPENKENYYTIYKDGKIVGRSNRESALFRFLANIKLAPNEVSGGYTIKWDGDDKEHIIRADGFIMDAGGNTGILSEEYVDVLF